MAAMRLKYIILFVSLFFLSIQSIIEWEIVIPTFNNQQWCIQNIESLVNQTYKHWHATIIIDCANDQTEELIRLYIEENHLEHKITIIVNTENQGALSNIYHAVTACPPHKVIGLLDGDDWLAHETVLEYLSEIYEKKNIWMTYGQFELWPENRVGHCRPYPENIIKENSFRYLHGTLPSHFRTFYAWLFQLIKKRDLLYEGKFFPVTWDLAMMLPMIEMAGKHHKCISKILYIYNIQNPLNDFKLHTELQAKLDRYIRTKKRYKPLEKKPNSSRNQ
ncbi:MAG: glycosyltransferase family 2 protein [Candidatus Babeliaceae bacterium]|nr:glycosyltransferase family 2 protein [Candidatus Babeliaceae bacterium]